MSDSNPFRIHGTVTGGFFADREAEVRRVLETFAEPAAKLLLYGPRRMGKTSILRVALERVRDDGGNVLLADLSTASTLADISNRILAAASRELGHRWTDWLGDLVRRIRVRLTLDPDPVTGLVLPSLEAGLRTAELSEQRETLQQVLDAIEAMAAEREATVGIALDEFQEIHRFGGEDAEWHLRGVIQNHDRISYVLAGSQETLIRRMVGEGRAFYGMLDVLKLGPIDPRELAGWIEERMTACGISAEGAGRRIVALAAPRTRDVVQLARKAFDLAATGGSMDPDRIERAFAEIVEEEDEFIRSLWDGLTSLQQNVLRAVAGGDAGLTTSRTMDRFGLTESGSASNAARALLEDGILTRGDTATGYAFDSPYFRGWVVTNALGDVGIDRPPAWRPDPDAR